MLSTRDSLQGERCTETESEGIEKDFVQTEESKSSNTPIRQNRL